MWLMTDTWNMSKYCKIILKNILKMIMCEMCEKHCNQVAHSATSGIWTLQFNFNTLISKLSNVVTRETGLEYQYSYWKILQYIINIQCQNPVSGLCLYCSKNEWCRGQGGGWGVCNVATFGILSETIISGFFLNI